MVVGVEGRTEWARGALAAVTALLVAFVVAAALADAASAARPAGGSVFYGFPGTEPDELDEEVAGVRVSRSGRSFARGSYVEVRCGGGRDVTLGSRVRIRRDGTFVTRARRRGLRVRLRGRFATRGLARVRYRARRGRCRARGLVTLWRNGSPPFSSCRRERARTVRRTSRARVFEQLQINQPRQPGGWLPYLFACAFDSNKRVTLARNHDDEEVEHVRLAGNFVGFVTVFTAVGGGGSSIKTIDLRSGAERVANEISSPGSLSAGGVHDFEVKESNGSFAWIAVRTPGQFDPPVQPNEKREVWALERGGPRMLDSGLGIDRTSLTLSGSTVSWRNGGAARSATID